MEGRIKEMNSGLMTVSNYLKGDKKKVPYIRLRGVWLKDYGFEVGSSMAVETQDGEIRLKLIRTDEGKKSPTDDEV